MAQRKPIRALRAVPAKPGELFDFLSDLENHWQIAGDFVEVVALEGPPGRRDGGVVRMCGPLGIRRIARTRVVAARRPREMIGRAELGGGTSATVRWTLWPAKEGSRVELAATIDSAAWLDRLMLALGGRAWLRRRFDGALERLAAAQRAAAVDDDDLEGRTPWRVSLRS